MTDLASPKIESCALVIDLASNKIECYIIVWLPVTDLASPKIRCYIIV